MAKTTSCFEKFNITIVLAVIATAIHYMLSRGGAASYSKQAPELQDFVHLSVQTATTVGFGDFVPLDLPGRAVTWAQTILTMYVLVVM